MQQTTQGLSFQAIADPAAGELRIGCPEITMAGLLPAIVARFSKQYPRVRLHVELLQAIENFIRDVEKLQQEQEGG